MKRFIPVVLLVFLLSLTVSIVPAFADGPPRHSENHACEVAGAPPGDFVSFIAQEIGHSDDNNPGNAKNPSPPFVPFVAGCNPTS